MKINKLLTKVNYTKSKNRKIKYIVIHYVGATGGAQDNCRYFEKFYRGASAHYFVGHAGEVWQCVEDSNTAWHCGALKYKHKECRNDNSIGVELCCRQDGAGKWYFEDKTVASAVELVKELMAKYNVPIGNVIRHYDVSGKQCPAPFDLNNTKHTWATFTNSLKNDLSTDNNKLTVENENKKPIDTIAKEVIQGKWGNGEERVRKLTAAGYDYRSVQARVNDLLSGGGQAVIKSVETVAKEVWQGKWGNGTTRRKKLEAAGYNYAEVQAMVNKLKR